MLSVRFLIIIISFILLPFNALAENKLYKCIESYKVGFSEWNQILNPIVNKDLRRIEKQFLEEMTNAELESKYYKYRYEQALKDGVNPRDVMRKPDLNFERMRNAILYVIEDAVIPAMKKHKLSSYQQLNPKWLNEIFASQISHWRYYHPYINPYGPKYQQHFFDKNLNFYKSYLKKEPIYKKALLKAIDMVNNGKVHYLINKKNPANDFNKYTCNPLSDSYYKYVSTENNKIINNQVISNNNQYQCRLNKNNCSKVLKIAAYQWESVMNNANTDMQTSNYSTKLTHALPLSKFKELTQNESWMRLNQNWLALNYLKLIDLDLNFYDLNNNNMIHKDEFITVQKAYLEDVLFFNQTNILQISGSEQIKLKRIQDHYHYESCKQNLSVSYNPDLKRFWDKWKKSSNYKACNGFEKTKKQYENNCNRGSKNDCDLFWIQVQMINSNCKDIYKAMNQERDKILGSCAVFR